jgi:hypothetical protein
MGNNLVERFSAFSHSHAQTGWPDWPNFRQFGYCFFNETSGPHKWPLLFSLLKLCIDFDKKWAGLHILGDFFTDSSGHPAHAHTHTPSLSLPLLSKINCLCFLGGDYFFRKFIDHLKPNTFSTQAPYILPEMCLHWSSVLSNLINLHLGRKVWEHIFILEFRTNFIPKIYVKNRKKQINQKKKRKDQIILLNGIPNLHGL